MCISRIGQQNIEINNLFHYDIKILCYSPKCSSAMRAAANAIAGVPYPKALQIGPSELPRISYSGLRHQFALQMELLAKLPCCDGQISSQVDRIIHLASIYIRNNEAGFDDLHTTRQKFGSELSLNFSINQQCTESHVV